MTANYLLNPPVAIGGVGGSGTRVIASIMQKLGFYMGSDLNEAHDNLAFTLLFKRAELWPLEHNMAEIGRLTDIYLNDVRGQQPWSEDDISLIRSLSREERPGHPREWLAERAEKLISNKTEGRNRTLWGWKEPNTHILLPALLKAVPNIKYIHVMRHGLDMAFSSNQNQLILWGRQLLGETKLDITPGNSFRYWCAAHRRILTIGKNMGGNFLLLNFDQLCKEPDADITKLLQFLRVDTADINFSGIKEFINAPSSTGRHKKNQMDAPSSKDLDFLYRLGYSR